MVPQQGGLPTSMSLLLAGAAVTVGGFIFNTGPAAFAELLPRVSGLLLWLVLPYLFLALNTFIVHRFLAGACGGTMFLKGSLTFLASGALIYGRAFLPAAESAMDAHLVFIFGPLYHFAAGALVIVGYLGRGFWLAVNRPVGEGEE